MYNLLSFPPDAKYCESGDHLSPQTSYLCAYDIVKLLDLFL